MAKEVNTVGKKIKTYLKENGISQAFLADKLNVSGATLSYWLGNGIKIDVMDYANIRDALGVSYDKFLPLKDDTA